MEKTIHSLSWMHTTITSSPLLRILELTLRVISLSIVTVNIVTVNFAGTLRQVISMPAELFLSLEPGDIHVDLVDLSLIVSYNKSSGDVKIMHASLVDFLCDKRRSTVCYIDIPSTCIEFAWRIFQCLKGPDGIAGTSMLQL